MQPAFPGVGILEREKIQRKHLGTSSREKVRLDFAIGETHCG
jgi:hypothetical protein